MRYLSILVVSVCFVLFSNVAQAEEVNYKQWEKVLRLYVDDKGLVDYKHLKDKPGLLDMVINEFKGVDVNSLTQIEQKAFWINAYNAYTLKLIVDNYPPNFGGIRSINWGKPWDVKMQVAGQELSLGDIEHKILRKLNPPDPRIHFAINCASIGCPVLPNKPFYPETLDAQLVEETKKFISNKDKVRLDREKKVLYHSAIFKWFKEDFLINGMTLKKYITNYLNKEEQIFIKNNKVKLKTLKYDWGLNDQK